MSSLADLLESHAEAVLSRWTERVRAAQAPGASEAELRDHMPELIRQLLARLRAGADAPPGEAAREHGRQRHRLGFDLDGLVREYRLLAECIFDLAAEARLAPTLDDARVLEGFTLDALAEAVREHGEQARAERNATEQRARRRADALLAEAQAEREKQHALFMQAPVAIAILEGPEHVYTFANPAYRALVNHRDVVGKTLDEALPDVRGMGFDRMLDGVMATGAPLVMHEMPIRFGHHVGDEVLIVDFVYTAMRDAAGAVTGVLVSCADVTAPTLARRRSEALAEEVRRREAELRAVTDAVPVLISFVGPDERYVLANRAYEEWFGLRRDEVVGREVREVIGDAAYARLGPYVKRGLAGEHFGVEEYAVPYRLGGARDVRINFVPHRDAAGAVDGYISLLVDITAERRHATEREALLAEAHRARAVAEEANELKDQFLATVSHELRTPLTAMLGWTRLLRGGALAEEQRARALETVERNAQAQVRLVDDLLDVGRILSGKLRLDVAPVDLVAVAEAALDGVRPAAGAKALRLLATLDPAAGPVLGDAARLQQVAWNLLSNAVKFTPRGGDVRVRLARLDAAVELTVSDSGQGIAGDFLPHVFDRFRQADASSTRAHGGLGLGLSIVRQLVELHGGTVRVQSEGAGRGATFTVRLPTAAMTAPAERRASRPSLAPAAELDCPAEVGGLRVLLVDDEPDVVEVLAVTLAHCGAEVSSAGSVAEALAAFAARRPDVVLSDIGMPGEDGFALIHALRSRSPAEGGRVPVVALTAYARPDDRKRTLRAGFNMHLAKPVDPAEVLDVVASLARQFPRA